MQHRNAVPRRALAISRLSFPPAQYPVLKNTYWLNTHPLFFPTISLVLARTGPPFSGGASQIAASSPAGKNKWQ